MGIFKVKAMDVAKKKALPAARKGLLYTLKCWFS
jgi:hypothetical protein